MIPLFSIATDKVINVGTTSTEILPANGDRVYARITNDSDSVVYINLYENAEVNHGIRLNANGGYYEIMGDNLFTGPVYGITASGTKRVITVENRATFSSSSSSSSSSFSSSSSSFSSSSSSSSSMSSSSSSFSSSSSSSSSSFSSSSSSSSFSSSSSSSSSSFSSSSSSSSSNSSSSSSSSSSSFSSSSSSYSSSSSSSSTFIDLYAGKSGFNV